MVAQPPTKATEADVASLLDTPSSSSATAGGWSPSSWRTRVARQMPKYDDPALVTEVEGILAKQAPLVFAGEVRVAIAMMLMMLSMDFLQLSKSEPLCRWWTGGSSCDISFSWHGICSWRELQVTYCSCSDVLG